MNDTLNSRLNAVAHMLENENYHSQAAVVREAVEALDPAHEFNRKLTFGDLDTGEHFICFPLPGDNSGHGGYLGGTYLFVKTNALKANNVQRNIESTFPPSMYVIKVHAK